MSEALPGTALSKANGAPLFKKVALLGAGLIGSSLAWAIRERGLAEHVAAYSRRAETREVIDILGFADSLHAEPGDAVADADLVIFDPHTVIDRATFEDPLQSPAGIQWVIVNGQIAVEAGKITGAASGKVLRRSGN